MTLFDGKTPSEKIPEKIKRKKEENKFAFQVQTLRLRKWSGMQ
jgi:hypothetical protein